MKLKLLTLIPMIGLTSSTPVAAVTTSNVANVVTLNSNKDENKIEISDKLSVVKSINKSCDCLVDFKREVVSEEHHCLPKTVSLYDFNSLLTIEDDAAKDAKKGQTERENLFTSSVKGSKYEAYYRYKSNNIEKSDRRSWGNAKKYQLNVTVPANTPKYKIEVIADCKLKNCLTKPQYFALQYEDRSVMQGNLSKLSTDPNEVLMPTMGIKDNNKFKPNSTIKLVTQNSFFYDKNNCCDLFESKPYIKTQLHSEITLSNTKAEPVIVPVYFWYAFLGGGHTGAGTRSHVNCSEVTFRANHIA